MKKLTVISIFWALVMFSCFAANSAAAYLPDTGQTKCYQGVSPYAEIPCGGTGQDGEYAINPMSFTDNLDGTITDNNTGLMWQKCSVGQNKDASCSAGAQFYYQSYNWYQAAGVYDATYNPSTQNVCSSLVLGGHSDWRLPSKKELMSIVDYTIWWPGTTINTTYFLNTQPSGYWSSTIYANDSSYAWILLFSDGSGTYYRKGGAGFGYVRCVRGGQMEFGTFTDNQDGTVTDSSTGLIWQQGEGGAMSWQGALDYCENLNLANKTDWRLPNIKELESLVDDTSSGPVIETNFFPDVHASRYWSSTTSEFDYAKFVHFSNSNINGYLKSTSNFARCLRGGKFQSGPGAVRPTNKAFGNYVDSPFDLTTVFFDYANDITGCEYTTDGTTWSPATLSGSLPSYTCSKMGITGTNGQELILNMRTIGIDDIETASTISRTVDTAGPITADNASSVWTTVRPVTVRLTPSDGTGAGVAETRYCVDTTGTCTPTTPGTSIAVSCPEGAKCIQYVRYYSIDNVGNEETVKTSVQIRQRAHTLSEVLDHRNLVWRTGGSAVWSGQTTQTHDGVDAAQSGDVADRQSSWMETTITGPGILSFYWKVSSEYEQDYLSFYINGMLQSGRISGNIDWQQRTYEIASGSNTVRWVYSKSFVSSSGSDAGWVDQVEYEPIVLPAPGLISPAGNIGDTYSPTYQWYVVTGAVSYDLWVGKAGIEVMTQSGLRPACGDGVCSIMPSVTLTNGTYTWKIKARNTAGTSPWSSELGFVVQGDALSFKLPDTGQSTCYKDVYPYAQISCGGTGQDGAYNNHPMSFTDSYDGTVTDNNTGLMWQKCSAGQNNDASCSGNVVLHDWYTASGTYDAFYNPSSQDVCGSLMLGGHSDWRLPTKRELLSIAHYGIPFITINTTNFPNTSGGDIYWSSTTYVDHTNYAWSMNFGSGSVLNGEKYFSGAVRCVRGEQLDLGYFIDQDDGTIIDNSTGLTWQQGESGVMSWQVAIDYCNGLQLANKTDWRLPNIKELESLVEDTRVNPAIYMHFFPNTAASDYWASTRYVDYRSISSAWNVHFGTGAVNNGSIDDSKYVRCVRDGQRGNSIIPPSNLLAKAISSSRIVLSWEDNSKDETGFKIERKAGVCDSANEWAEIATKTADATSHTNINLIANRAYSYRVRAHKENDYSDFSNCASARTAPSGAPNIPSDLKAIAVTASRINLTWTDSAVNETTVEVWRKAGAGAWGLLTTLPADAVSHSDTTAIGNSATKTYSYYLKACNAAGCSPMTSTAIVPYRPMYLTAAASAGEMDLVWTDQSTIETGFQVYRKDATCAGAGSFGLRATKGANVTTHSDTGLASGATHAYKVRAYKKSASAPYAYGYSLWSNCDDAVVP